MKRTISKTINLLIGIIVLWTWLSVTFRLGRLGAQSEGGLGNLRYFTVLSNLLQCGVSLAYCCGRKVSRWKYASTTAIAFTFFVVLFFLGPARGYDAVYTGANFWSHLVVPLLAMVDFLCFDREGTFTLRDSVYAMLPVLYREPAPQRCGGERLVRVCQGRSAGRGRRPSCTAGCELDPRPVAPSSPEEIGHAAFQGVIAWRCLKTANKVIRCNASFV